MNFSGRYNINIDAKCRFAIPRKLQDGLMEVSKGQIVITRDPNDPCLILYPKDVYDRAADPINALPNNLPEARHLRRVFVGHAVPMELEKNGRILLPPSLRVKAQLDKGDTLVMMGLGGKYELWNEALYEASAEEDAEVYRDKSGASPSLGAINY